MLKWTKRIKLKMVSKCFKMFRRINSIITKLWKNARNSIIFTIRKYSRNFLKLCLERSKVEHYGRSCVMIGARNIFFYHVTSCMHCKTDDSINFNIGFDLDNDTVLINCSGFIGQGYFSVLCPMSSVQSDIAEKRWGQMRSQW